MNNLFGVKTAIAVLIAATETTGSAMTITFTDLTPSVATSSEVRAASGLQQGGIVTINGQMRAALWAGSANSFANFDPGTYQTAINALSTSGQYGTVNWSGPRLHAAMWSGTPASCVDLNPPFAISSGITAANAAQQGGVLTLVVDGPWHAALWSGTATACVDLHPSGSVASYIEGMSDTQQVGWVDWGTGPHAALWTGTPDSIVDLNPIGATNSVANGASESQQFGTATFSGVMHAALWSGSAASFVDMHPVGADASSISAANGSLLVGTVTMQGSSCAALWLTNAPNAWINLGRVLGSGYSNSEGIAITSVGNTTYISGNAVTAGGQQHAMLWIVTFLPQLSLIRTFQPSLAVQPAFSSLSLGTNYQLQVSSDLITWKNSGAAFIATNTSMTFSQSWEVYNSQQLFFRLQTAP